MPTFELEEGEVGDKSIGRICKLSGQIRPCLLKVADFFCFASVLYSVFFYAA